MEEKKYKGYWLVSIDDWTYKWIGKEPAPRFPYLRTLFHLIRYNLKGDLKHFPVRFYKTLKRLLTNSLKPEQAPSGNL